MSRPRDEMQFGSDSFLDVLANMVGILIILIVIAGARVGRAPIPLMRDILAAREQQAHAVVADAEFGAGLPTPPNAPTEGLTVGNTNSPPRDITDKLAAIEAELAELSAQAEQQAKALELTAAQEEELKRQRETEEHRIARQTTLLTDVRQRAEQAKNALLVHKLRLTGLLAENEQVEATGAKVEKLVHRTTPISQEVSGNELHFRLADQKVAVIPLEGLMNRLRIQMERQKQTLATSRSFQGTAGPVDGFSLQYLMERQAASPFDEIRHGTGVFRVAVSAWKLIPERDVEAETAEQAVQRGSRFITALKAAPPNATITLWVYPDSFGLFRKLQAAAHAEGFTVAARPLPNGVPIAGSPNGTRSAGQ
ncbi:MAG: hypothetical protein HZA46_15210 [Planctomycetales bacterium]|nr:hypothetical protein [Planctomycetales bacterium]